MLGAAVWRNLFDAESEVDWVKVAIVVGFMRRGLRGLDRASDETIVGAMVRFGNPMSERAVVVGREARGMGRPFSKEEEEELESFTRAGGGGDPAAAASPREQREAKAEGSRNLLWPQNRTGETR